MKTWVKWLLAVIKWAFFIFLLIAPIFVIKYLFEIKYLDNDNWGELIGGCLGYYGTIILGIVAISQTQISLRQNAKTFIADKYSVIKIRKECVIQTITNDLTAYENRHKYHMNQFYISYKNDFAFDESLRFVDLIFNYDSVGFLINSLKIKAITINYKEKLFINSKVITDLCENPKKSCGQMEVVFMLTENEFNGFNEALRKGQLILNFTFEIISAVGVKMTENIEVNFSSGNSHIKIFDKEQYLSIGTTSYSYLQGE